MWIKICGITRPEDARLVAALKPDAIGLNFYTGSKRCVDVSAARKIMAELPPQVEPVGLFVNHTAEEIRRICEACSLTTIQLHGDETAEFAAGLTEFRILKAFRVDEGNWSAVRSEIAAWTIAGVPFKACLIDAKVEGAFGGTGKSAPWELLARDWDAAWPPLLLAGGLTPGNVAEAIWAVHPWGVDVAGGVEQSPGIKDAVKVAEFIQQARAALS